MPEPYGDVSSFVELSLKESGHEVCIPDKIFRFTPKTYHLFHYVISGHGTYDSGNFIHTLKKGDIFYIAPGSAPHYAPSKKDPWTYTWLGFDGSSVPAFLLASGISANNPIIHDKDNLAKEYFERINAIHSEKGYFDLSCLGEAYKLFEELIENGQPDQPILSVTESKIHSAKEFILNNYQFPISVIDISKNSQVTPNYLANIFTKHEKMSPKQFLTKTRMEKAAVLISTGVYKINEVGKMVGYPNQLHFSNEFKKYYGVSPSKYIKKE